MPANGLRRAARANGLLVDARKANGLLANGLRKANGLLIAAAGWVISLF